MVGSSSRKRMCFPCSHWTRCGIPRYMVPRGREQRPSSRKVAAHRHWKPMPETIRDLPVDVDGWNRLFAESGDEYFFGREAGELTRLTYQYWKIVGADRPARVLDLGSGEGRDSVYFAGKRFHVTA